MANLIDVDGKVISFDRIAFLDVEAYTDRQWTSGKPRLAWRVIAVVYSEGIRPLTLWHTNKSLVYDAYYKMTEALESGAEEIDPMEIMRELIE